MSMEQTTVRTTGRIKKPKMVFDPSDYDNPRNKMNIGHVTGSISLPSDRASATPTPGVGDLKKNQRSPASSTCSDMSSVDTCFICCKKEAKRGFQSRNKMIQCQQCVNKAHRLCLPIDFEDYDLLAKKYKCIQCRLCAICLNKASAKSGNVEDLVTCSKCIRSFHLDCCRPPIDKVSAFSRNWQCNDCVKPKMEAIHHIIGSEQKPQSQSIAKATTNANKPLNQNAKKMHVEGPEKASFKIIKANEDHVPVKHNLSRENSLIRESKFRKIPPLTPIPRSSSSISVVTSSDRKAEKTNGQDFKSKISSSVKINEASSSSFYNPLDPIDIPKDVKFWDINQVYTFFSKFFPNEAYIFKDHEIDGTSLMLLKRSDVVKKLPIKLGPALRIYNLVLKLQSQTNDPTLGWNIGQ